MKIHVARSSRGKCAGCGKSVKRGDRYGNAWRYARGNEKPTPGLARGRKAIVLHEKCAIVEMS